MPEVIVIGGGAAGMAAAIAAAECGDNVLLLERMDRVGKKLLATGNGRCNLMNEGAPRYPGGTAFAGQVLAICGADRQKRFWQAHGLHMRTEDGDRVYPASGQATTVLDVLRLAMSTAGVQIVTGATVTGVRRKAEQWLVKTDSGTYSADRVIIAGGGCAQPKLGSDGSCWPILASSGHKLIQPRPCLTQIETDTEPIRGLSGIRIRCTVSVIRRDTIVHCEQGEALFADYGVSGVCVMQCARFVKPGDTLSLNLLTGIGFEHTEDMLSELKLRKRMWPDQAADQLLSGLFVPRLALSLMKAAGIRCNGALIRDLN